jgi:hypothetical protein
MELYDAFILNIEIESLGNAHRRREEACRRRAAALIARAERHAAIAKRLSAMQAELPWRDTEQFNTLSRHFYAAFGDALLAADQIVGGVEGREPSGETPEQAAEHKEGWPNPDAEILF